MVCTSLKNDKHSQKDAILFLISAFGGTKRVSKEHKENPC